MVTEKNFLLQCAEQPFFTNNFILRIIPERILSGVDSVMGKCSRRFLIRAGRADEDELCGAFAKKRDALFHLRRRKRRYNP